MLHEQREVTAPTHRALEDQLQEVSRHIRPGAADVVGVESSKRQSEDAEAATPKTAQKMQETHERAKAIIPQSYEAGAAARGDDGETGESMQCAPCEQTLTEKKYCCAEHKEQTFPPDLPDAKDLEEGPELYSEPLYSVKRMSSEVSPHPRAKLEGLIAEVVEFIRMKPTIPADPQNPAEPWSLALSEETAIQLPGKHCAFRGCSWSGETDAQLYNHISSLHEHLVRPAMEALSSAFTLEERMEGVYNKSAAERCRQGAPTASYAIDRRCICNYASAMQDHNIQEPICFVCACTYPYVGHREEEGKFTGIRWVKHLSASNQGSDDIETCFGMNWSETYYIFGLDGYLDRFGIDAETGLDLNNKSEEFEPWTLEVSFAHAPTVRLLRCPEDRKCKNKDCQDSEVMCKHCSVPVCVHCLQYLNREPTLLCLNKQPPQALTNDMMIFYDAGDLYAEGGMTVVEMMCASVRITSMICFAMEIKHGLIRKCICNDIA